MPELIGALANYPKQWLTFQEQLVLLEARGLQVDNRQAALNDLERIGYYRLSAYWYSFRKRVANHVEGVDTPLDEFIPDSRFEDAVALYNFDRQLRLTLMDAVERLEIAIRVQVAHVIGMKGPFAHLDVTHLDVSCQKPSWRDASITQYQEFNTKLTDAVRDSKEAFAKHHREKYGGQIPIWAAIELWDFGMLSRFFQMMILSDREGVAARFGLNRYKTLANWLESLNLLRNICAHHGRLYRRSLVISPAIPKNRDLPEFEHLRRLGPVERVKLYPLLCVIVFLMRSAAPDSQWKSRFVDLLATPPTFQGAGLAGYGFPSSWMNEEFWKL